MPARVAILCPENCQCEKAGYIVRCDGPSLTAVPLIHLTDVRVLRLDKNNITLLERDRFVSRGLTELEILIVSNCVLRTIELGAFNGLTKLTELSINVNKIREIISGTFEDMMSLKILDLRYNGIEHLDRHLFVRLVNLRSVILLGNKLQYLHPDTFLWLPNLQSQL